MGPCYTCLCLSPSGYASASCRRDRAGVPVPVSGPGVLLTAVQLFAYATLGLYQSFRKVRLRQELEKLWLRGRW